MTSQDRQDAEAFEEWCDNLWASAEQFSEEVIEVIENNTKYKGWKEKQEDIGREETDDETELSTYVEPFELYKLLATTN